MAYSVNTIRRTTFQQTHTVYFGQYNTAYWSSDTCMTLSSTMELLSPFENPERILRSRRKLFETPSLAESSSPEIDQISEIKEHIEEEEVTEIMAETMEQYMSKTHDEIGSGVARPTIDADIQFELKGQFLKELRDNTFSGLEHEDANEHIKKF
ncbi:hypothetical protein Tco_0302443 [Tanacetum coccineum]